MARSGSQKILGIRPSWSRSGRDSSCLRHSAGEARTPRGRLEGVLLVVVDLRAMLAMIAMNTIDIAIGVMHSVARLLRKVMMIRRSD